MCCLYVNLWTCKVFSFSFLVLFSSFFFVCVCVYWVCEQVCACARWVTHNTNTHSTCTISYKSLTPSQNALCVFFFFFSLSLSLSKRKGKKKRKKKKRKKKHQFLWEFMEPELQKYHLLHSLLPKVLLVFMEDFFFFIIQEILEIWERQNVEQTSHPPLHTLTHVWENINQKV